MESKGERKKEQVDESKSLNRILRLPTEIVLTFELLMRSTKDSYSDLKWIKDA